MVQSISELRDTGERAEAETGRQEPKQRPLKNTADSVASLVRRVCFLIQTKTPYPRVAPGTMDPLLLAHPSLVIKIPHRHSLRSVWWSKGNYSLPCGQKQAGRTIVHMCLSERMSIDVHMIKAMMGWPSSSMSRPCTCLLVSITSEICK